MLPCPGRYTGPRGSGRGASAVGTDALPPMSPAQPERRSARPRTRLGAPHRGIRRVSDEERLGHRIVAIMTQREQYARGSFGAGDRLRPTPQHHGGRLAALAAHLELAPVHAHAEPGAQRLERRLLGREARGQVGNGIAPAPAVGDLVIGEHTTQETIVPALHHAAEARDLGEVDADALDVRHEPMAFLMIPDSSVATDSMCDRSSPSTTTRARFSVPEERRRMRPAGPMRLSRGAGGPASPE